MGLLLGVFDGVEMVVVKWLPRNEVSCGLWKVDFIIQDQVQAFRTNDGRFPVIIPDPGVRKIVNVDVE